MTAPATPSERHAAEARFIAALGDLERGPLAELRRSLSYRSGKSYFLERLIYDHLPKYQSAASRDAAYLVAGLYALVERPHDAAPQDDAPEPEGVSPEPRSMPRSLGYAMGRLYRAQDERPSTEKRFLALLDADEEQLTDHLRYAVTLLNAGELKPDWAQLLADAAGWHRPDSRGRTRDRWARDFYRPEQTARPDADPKASIKESSE